MAHKSWIAQPKKKPNSKEKPWEVKRENADRASKDFKTQEKSWKHAKKLARKNSTSQKPATAKLKLKRNGEFKKIRRYNNKSNSSSRRY